MLGGGGEGSFVGYPGATGSPRTKVKLYTTNKLLIGKNAHKISLFATVL